MRNKFKIVGLALTLFLLVGCDQLPEDIIDKIPEDIVDQIVDLLPSVELVGDDVIIVEQNTEFVDPGVEIPGDFDLDVTVVSDVDTSIVGDYTVTYTIEYEGITYSGERTIRVVAPVVPVDFNWELRTGTVTSDSIAVFVSYTDTDGLLENGKVTLYQGDTSIESKDLVTGDNHLDFDNLQANTDYKVVVEGTYLDNTVSTTVSGQELTVTTAELTSVDYVLSGAATTHNSYTVNINTANESSNIESRTAYLYFGEFVVKEMVLTDTDSTFTAEGLLTSTEYVLKIVYAYTPVGASTATMETSVLSTFSTDAVTNAEPEFSLFLCTVESNRLECAVGVDVTGLTDVSLYVETWEGDTLVSTTPVTLFDTYANIIGLNAGTEYTLKLYADYKVVDSELLVTGTLVHEEVFTTTSN